VRQFAERDADVGLAAVGAAELSWSHNPGAPVSTTPGDQSLNRSMQSVDLFEPAIDGVVTGRIGATPRTMAPPKPCCSRWCWHG
jgi:hypothetical protein